MSTNKDFSNAPGVTLDPSLSKPRPDPQLLNGLWVTSHVGLLQMTKKVQDPFGPPQTAGYDVTYIDGVPSGFTQREGFFHTAAVTFYVFDGKGKLSGYMEHVRGGHGQYQQVSFTGTYKAFKSELPAGHILSWGRLFVDLPVGPWHYYFVMKNPDELEWVWTPPPINPPPDNRYDQERPLIARGTMTKVRS
jgi:hypothetical protein